MGAAWWRAGFIVLILCGVATRGQVIRQGAAHVHEKTRLALPLLNGPSLLIIEGRRTRQQRVDQADVEIRMDGARRPPLSKFRIGAGIYRAHLPIDVTAATRGRRPVLELVPDSGGFTVGPIRVVPAGVLEVVLRDPAGTPVSGIVEVVSAAGDTPPLFGYLQSSSHAGSAQLIDHQARMLVPAGVPLKLLAWTHPFRAPCRRSVTARPGGRAGVKFVLGADLRPAKSAVLGGKSVSVWKPETAQLIDRVLGVAERSQRPGGFAAETVEVAPSAFVARMLRKDALPPLVIDRRGPQLTPKGPRSVCTLRLANGRLLHSNGPVIESEILYRDRTTGRVEGTLMLRLPADVASGRLVLQMADKKLLEIPIDQAGRIPLDLDVKRATRVAAVFYGKRFEGDPIAGPRPFAATILVMP